ncbi:Variant surface glycoprotein [Trypanosoma congolense IL3000]|uniref:Variant surface glycoprotein n=1 Tax=Trypanosoma congolense (strain IL3000) TaxID=1068625 RepID=F9WD93_TRYCI|nr:Variant surface glycoprotein [Trypanosoma congolense IL3000]
MGIQMMMRFCMFVLLLVEVVVNASVTDHNQEAHKALCDVLRAAVNKWEGVRRTASPLKEALRKTIFGKNGGDTDISSGLQMPTDYKPPDTEGKKKPNTRKHWCGACGSGSQNHYPGESAPHDLVCLCTPGEFGHPVNDGEKTLCGQSKGAWGENQKGWHTELFNDNEKEREYLNQTWGKIVKDCSQNGNENNLETALKTFTDKLESLKGNQYLGIHNSNSDCSGTAYGGLCVLYATKCEKKPWFEELKDAIQKEKEEMEQQKNLAKAEKQEKLKAMKGLQNTPQKSTQNPQPTQRDSQSPQTEEPDDSPRAEQVISNMNATIEEDSSTIMYPFWLLLVFLYN